MKSGFINITFGVFILGLVYLQACTPTPQRAKHLNECCTSDSTLIKQIQFNLHMADLADKSCQEFVKKSHLTYALDDSGFWFTKIVTTDSDTIKRDQEVLLHILITELDGTVLSDTKDYFIISEGYLPTAISRAVKNMKLGEQMHIVAPWYSAYGREGTAIIKPYSNLLISITTEQ